MLHRDFGSDHVHPTTYNNDSEFFEGVTYPDWESIDFNVDGLLPEEGTVTFSDMSAALSSKPSARLVLRYSKRHEQNANRNGGNARASSAILVRPE